MKKRGVLDLPAREVKEKGTWITSTLFNDLLVLDCFGDGKQIGRYCVNGEGEYASWQDGKWHEAMLGYILGMEPYYSYWDYSNHAKFATPEDEAIAREFLKCEPWRHATLDRLSRIESETSGKKRESTKQRKQDRIDSLMDLVPVLPNDFDDWCSDVIFKGKEFIFPGKRPEWWFCTACGKQHKLTVKLKHNQETTCRRTNKIVTAKTRQKQIVEKHHCMVLQQIDNTRSVARHFALIKEWNSEGTEQQASEEIRYILGRGKDKGNVNWYYGQLYDSDEFAQEWRDRNPINRHCYVEYCYPRGAAEALAGTAYENIGIPEMAARGWQMQYNKIMIQRSRAGVFEYFVKANLERLARELSNSYSTYEGYNSSLLNISGKRADEVLKVNMQRFHRLKQRNGGINYLKWLQWEESKKRKIPEESIQWLADNKVDPDDIKFMEKYMSPVQVANYLSRQQAASKRPAPYLLGIWKDYLSMAKRFGMDINDEIVYRTKDLILRHDELLEVINQQDNDKAAKKMRKTYPKVESILKSIKKQFEYANEDFVLIVPDSIRDIMQDSRTLHHCAGSSEVYFGKIDRCASYIMFLRRAGDPQHPYYTLEVEPDGKVIQKRSEYNRQPDLQEINAFLGEWQKVLKDRRSQESKKTKAKKKKVELQSEKQNLRAAV